jgi:hypothetical protein
VIAAWRCFLLFSSRRLNAETAASTNVHSPEAGEQTRYGDAPGSR